MPVSDIPQIVPAVLIDPAKLPSAEEQAVRQLILVLASAAAGAGYISGSTATIIASVVPVFVVVVVGQLRRAKTNATVVAAAADPLNANIALKPKEPTA